MSPTLKAVPATHYDELVRRGREAREAADGAQWVEGDLALEVETLPADEIPRDPEAGHILKGWEGALKRYANDIGVGYASITQYRRVAEAWPADRRLHTVPWGVHHALAAQEDRFDLIQPGMTVAEARKLVSRRTAGNTGKPGWHELLGGVGDHLKAAEKAMDKVEAAVGDEVANQKFREKAGRYATWADELARRLRAIAADNAA